MFVKIGETKDVRVEAELEFHHRPIPIGNNLIVDVEVTPDGKLLKNGGSFNGDASLPSTPLVGREDDTAVDNTPKPGYPFPNSSKNDDPTSPGPRSPISELGSTLSAPPTPTKSKNKNAQRKAARKRAKNKKKNLGELEETEGEDESTTTDQSKPQEPELTVWDRVRNLKNKGETSSSATDRERERRERERQQRGAETPTGLPAQTIQVQTFNDLQQCNWCGNTHSPSESFEIWERVADNVFPKQNVS